VRIGEVVGFFFRLRTCQAPAHGDDERQATTIAIADPENVAAASDLLTHEKRQMTQRYLLQGRQTAAIRAIGDLITRRRKSGRRARARSSSKSLLTAPN
jgi:hypothetical protein